MTQPNYAALLRSNIDVNPFVFVDLRVFLVPSGSGIGPARSRVHVGTYGVELQRKSGLDTDQRAVDETVVRIASE